MNFKALVRSLFRKRGQRTIVRKEQHFRPTLELLEDRLAPANFMVTNNADAGVGSLRQAILDANLTPAADTITFAAGLNNQTILLGGTELAITKPLTITGPGAALLKIDANNASRIFNVDDGGGTSIDVAISGLTLTKGSASGAAITNAESLTVTNLTLSANSGGGIYSTGTLTVTNSTFSGNSASTGEGGGINNNNGTATVTNSTFSENSASGGGGIKNNTGTLTLTNSTLFNNSAPGAGGGIANVGTLILTNSILSNNSTQNVGGGIYNLGTATVTNSKIVGNTGNRGIYSNAVLTLTDCTVTHNAGGGILSDSSGTLNVVRSTIAANPGATGAGIFVRGNLNMINSTVSGHSITQGGGGIVIQGSNNFITNSTITNNSAAFSGGMHIDSSVTLKNTIVSGNTAVGGDQNLNSNYVEAGPNHLAGDPKLDALRNNGGPTQTHALMPGSPAIDAGSDALLVTPTGVTSSTSATDFWPASRLIDNSGLSGTPTLANLATTTHADASAENNAWLTAANAPDYYTALPAPVLTFTLPRLMSVTDMVVWGYAFLGSNNGEAKTFQVAFSTDNGATFGPAIPFEHRYTGTGNEVFSFGRPYAANQVRVTITDNYFGAPGATGGERVGLGEVKFIQASTDQRAFGFPRLIGAHVDIGAYEMPRALFTDSFDRANAATLGMPWANTFGGVGINTNRAIGTTVGANVAILSGLNAPDVDLYGDANLQTGVQSGLLARFVDANNYYGATLTKESTGLVTARLIKFVGGVYTELAVFENTATSGKLRLRVVGNSLQMYLAGTLLATAIDFSLTMGSVGIRTFGNQSTLDNFQAWPVSTGVDRFDPFTLPDNNLLSDPWVQGEGFFRTFNNRIQGGAAINRAVLQGAAQADVDLRTHVNITGTGHFASLLARYNGAADSWYQGTLIRDTNATVQAFLFRRSGGGFTQLGAMATIPAVSGSVNARLVVVGSSLKFYVNDQLVVQATDTMLTTGTVGLRSDNFASFDNFDVKTVRAELPFTENFGGQALDLPWVDQVAPFALTGGQAVPSNSAISLATLAGVNAQNAEVQADIAITNTGGVGSLVLGYNGPGNSNYYTALAYREPGNPAPTPFSLYLFRRDASTYVQLGPRVMVAALGTLKFRMLGNQLTLLLNNVQQITATDNTFTGGSVGIRGFVDPASAGTVTIDNFSATNLNFLPFNDSFTAATLDPNWFIRAGGYSTTAVAGKAAGTTAFNAMTLGRFNLANVDMSAVIEIASAAGNFANLLARVSGDGLSFYFGTIYHDGTQFKAEIYLNLNGALTLLGSQNLGANPIVGSTMRFTAIGGQLKLFLDAAELVAATDFFLTIGAVGIRSALNVNFDNFGVSAAT